ncbi:MAG: translation elongation factor Ts [Simkaniaceae bacterium]|nr:translation elongation factor Ts [Simkaniaceae bacterium]
MVAITGELVKKLRDRTGVGMGKCKKALEEAGGDIEAAIDHLRKSGMASAVKKESRETNEGMVGFSENDEVVALVEVNAETDFVVQNEKFQAFVAEVAKEAATQKPKDVDAFMGLTMANGMTVEAYRADHIQSLGENIRIRRLLLVPKHENRSIGIYSHMKGKIVSLVELDGASDQAAVARDVAMHAAAEDPEFLDPSEVPQDVIAREKEIAREQMKGKPDNVIDKILEGKMRAFYDQTCLKKQKFVKDPSTTVEKYVAAKGKESGKTLTISRYLRWQIGESI